MGQYWIPVNLTKKEFIDPHKLGTGLKLWEQLGNHPGTGDALLVLTAAMPERRGGGDLDLGGDDKKYAEIAERTIGRWAGDRIAIVGDYAADSDLQPRFKASRIYERCQETTHVEYSKNPKGAAFRDMSPGSEHHGLWAHYVVDKPPRYTDISADVCAVLEHELDGKFEGTGWRTFVPTAQK